MTWGWRGKDNLDQGQENDLTYRLLVTPREMLSRSSETRSERDLPTFADRANRVEVKSSALDRLGRDYFGVSLRSRFVLHPAPSSRPGEIGITGSFLFLDLVSMVPILWDLKA